MQELNVSLVAVGGLTLVLSLVAGLLFNQFADAGDEADEQKVQVTVLRLLTVPVFVLFGLVLPVGEWLALGWGGLALVVGVLLLRRLPIALVFDRLVDPVDGARDASFAAWFGPVGIAALLYATVARRLVGDGTVWAAVSLVVAGSVVVHGATSTPFTELYGRRADVDGNADEDPGATLGRE